MEYTATEKVPQKAQTYTFRDQIVVWFSSCSIPAAWYYGALMAGWRGIEGALLLILVVNTVSLIPWAYLGEIAAVTGGSSMAIVRPTFGIKGSLVPSIFYLIFGFGWAVVNVFLGAIGLSFIFKLWLGFPSYLDPHNIPYMVAYILIVCSLQSIFAVKGHRMIKKLQWIATACFVILGAYQSYIVLSHWGWMQLLTWKPKEMLMAAVGPYKYPITFALLADFLIAYNWTWEFIGDFSRFAKNKTAGTWGPFVGAILAQTWWFLVGALAVVYLSITTGQFNPVIADPSSTTVTLGLGWLAALIVLFAIITPNAGNLYASALGLSNIFFNKKIPLERLLVICSIIVFPLSLSPLLSKDFVGFYMFFLDFLGAIVVPLWTITLVDYFIVKKRKYSDDLFLLKKGAYWYSNGYHWPAIIILLLGTGVYWVFAYWLVYLRGIISATLPTVLFVTITYLFTAQRSKQ